MRGEIRGDTVLSLDTTERRPEPGRDLVEDEDDARLSGQLSQALQETLLRQNAACVEVDRLEDDRREFVAVSVYRRLERGTMTQSSA